MFGRRSDGRRVKDVKFIQAFEPFVIRTRTEAQVYIKTEMEIDGTLAYLERLNAGREIPITFFQAFLAAGVRMMAKYPELNRFISGRRIFQRKDIVFSFGVKKAMTEDAFLTIAKVVFAPDDNFISAAESVGRAIGARRKDGFSSEEKGMMIILRMPRLLTIPLMRAGVWLDRAGLYPKALMVTDPLFASVFFANLGSLGMGAAYHHLYNWGNVSMFIALGEIRKSPVPNGDGHSAFRNVVDVTFTIDRRITDGFTIARALREFAECIRNPEKLETGPA